MSRKPKKLPPMHPGEVLREEFMIPLGLSAYKVATACGIPRTRLERIAKESFGISTDTALRLARVFGTTPEFWTNLQTNYDLECVSERIGAELRRIAPLVSRESGQAILQQQAQ